MFGQILYDQKFKAKDGHPRASAYNPASFKTLSGYTEQLENILSKNTYHDYLAREINLPLKFKNSQDYTETIEKKDGKPLYEITFSIPENTTRQIGTVGVVKGAEDAVYYDFSGEHDHLFNFDQDTGAFSFQEAADYEAIPDEIRKNGFSFLTRAKSGNKATPWLRIIVKVEDVAGDFLDPPKITFDKFYQYNENDTTPIPLTATTTSADSNVVFELKDNIPANQYFELSPEGDLSFKTPPDFENKNQYILTFTAFTTNGTIVSAKTEYTCVIIIKDIENEPISPKWIKDAVEIKENTQATYFWNYFLENYDPDELEIEIVNNTDDADFFDITATSIRFKKPKNYENPEDSNKDNQYEITLRAVANSTNASSEQKISFTVTNIEEEKITLLNLRDKIINYTEQKIQYTESSSNTYVEGYSRTISAGIETPELEFQITGPDKDFVKLWEGWYNMRVIKLKDPLDFENPLDSDKDNTYKFTITAKTLDSPVLSTEVNYELEVQNDPKDDSNGPSEIFYTSKWNVYKVLENQTFAGQVKAHTEDNSVITFRISDNPFYPFNNEVTIEKNTGKLYLKETFDFESLNKTYGGVEVIVTATKNNIEREKKINLVIFFENQNELNFYINDQPVGDGPVKFPKFKPISNEFGGDQAQHTELYLYAKLEKGEAEILYTASLSNKTNREEFEIEDHFYPVPEWLQAFYKNNWVLENPFEFEWEITDEFIVSAQTKDGEIQKSIKIIWNKAEDTSESISSGNDKSTFGDVVFAQDDGGISFQNDLLEQKNLLSLVKIHGELMKTKK